MLMWASSLQRRILRTWKAVVESQNHYREQTLKAYWFWAHCVSRKVIQGFRIHARASRLQRFKAERLRIRLEADQRRRLLLRVWGTWCEVAFRNHRRAERFANERLLWKSLFAWRDTPRQSLLEQEEDRLARATIYHRRKCLNQGLGALLENKRINQKEREDEFAAIWFRWHVLTGGAFRNWVKMAKPAILYGQKVNSMRTNRSFVTKNRVFSMWKRHVEDSKKTCEQIAQALRHWARKALATAFHSWVYALTQKVKIRGCEIQAKLAVERLQKNRGIKALKLHLQNRKNSKTLIEKMDKQRSRTLLLQAFNCLRLSAAHSKQITRLNEIAKNHARIQCLRRTWNTMVLYKVQEIEHYKVGLSRAENFYSQRVAPRVCARSWHTWSEFCAQAQFNRVQQARAENFRCHFGKQVGLRVLQSNAASSRTSRLLNVQAVQFANEHKLRLAWVKWQMYHIWFLREAQKVAKANLHYCHRLYKWVWGFWVALHAEKQHERELAAFASQWRRKHLLRHSMAILLDAAIEHQTHHAAVIQSREAKRAASLADRVARIAFHWRDFTLRRRLARSETEITALESARQRPVLRTFRNPNPEANIRPPLVAPRYSHQGQNQTWSYEARAQVHASLSLDWLDALAPHATSGTTTRRARPAPRRPIDIVLNHHHPPQQQNVHHQQQPGVVEPIQGGVPLFPANASFTPSLVTTEANIFNEDPQHLSLASQHAQNSQNLSNIRSLHHGDLADDSMSSTALFTTAAAEAFAPGMGTAANSSVSPSLASQAREYLDLKRRVRADKRRRLALRDRLRTCTASPSETEVWSRELVLMQQRQAELRRRRETLLPLIRAALLERANPN